MSCHPRVTEWTTIIQTHLPHLTKPQATVLALWSLGMVLARSCALTAVSAFLATWLGRKEPAVRQQLREFCSEATAKRGTARCALAVEPCFVPLLAWVVEPVGGHPIGAGPRCDDLGHPLYRLGAQRGLSRLCHPSGLDRPGGHGQTRLAPASGCACCARCAGRFPRSWTVLVLADRGLYARWLFRRIARLGWHPFLRINTGGTFRPQGQVRGVALKTLVPEPGTAWRGPGIAFTGRHRQLHCTLLACWEAGDTDPWLILTDLPPEASTACWYGVRAWIEQGFKLTKRAGWQWQRTHMTKPDRAARLWLAVAVATLWLLRVGGEADATIPVEHGPGRHGPGPRAAADAACHPPAAGQCLSPGLEPDPGSLARPGTAAPGPLRPRTLAGGPGARGGDPIPAGAGVAPGRLRPQAAGATGTCMRVKIWA